MQIKIIGKASNISCVNWFKKFTYIGSLLLVVRYLSIEAPSDRLSQVVNQKCIHLLWVYE